MRNATFCGIALLALALVGGCGGSGGDGGSSSNDSGSSAGNGSGNGFGSGEHFVNFESGQVRPLALTSDESRLLVTNTPNATLDIFEITDSGLHLQQSVPVGLEPVAVAVRGDREAWVVNHLSDSISVIDLSQNPPRVVKTLLTGDEPRDIVFAGQDQQLAFVTAAHRGQNGPDDQLIDAQLTAPGVGRADVWVFDTEATGSSTGGEPLSVLSMFGDTLRSLTASADGSRVYAAVMHSGNQTTAVGENRIAKRGPTRSSDGAMQPDTGLIVQFDGQHWHDETGARADLNNVSYDSLVPFSLPDYDVFVIEADRTPRVVDRIAGVGTTLFDLIEHPVTGELYVSNTEALNVKRFEGSGLTGSTVRGNFIRNRLSVITQNEVLPRDLNKHLNHDAGPASAEARALSIAQPMGLAMNASGGRLYVTGFGSAKVAVYDTRQIKDDSFEVSMAQQVSLSDGGPTGVVLDETRQRLYVLTRFGNRISVVDTDEMTELQSVALFNPSLRWFDRVESFYTTRRVCPATVMLPVPPAMCSATWMHWHGTWVTRMLLLSIIRMSLSAICCPRTCLLGFIL